MNQSKNKCRLYREGDDEGKRRNHGMENVIINGWMVVKVHYMIAFRLVWDDIMFIFPK